MVVMNYKSGMINVFNRKRDMVNKRTLAPRYIQIVNMRETILSLLTLFLYFRGSFTSSFMRRCERDNFWNAYHKGYDFYSAHLFLKDINWLKSLAIGDYKMSFGQSVIMNAFL